MDEALLAAFLDTDYRVRLPRGGTATIRIGAPLPETLRMLAGGRPWGFLTAWNPGSVPQPRPVNRQAQRRLLADLRARADVELRAGLGVGRDGWREASLWVLGLDEDALAGLGRRYRQHAWLYGRGDAPARLRWRD
ncbi:DUF3293 domain-containing protein [Frateuria defendens]|uniref:DUF3293 domain-containing protein n=1 Tax=Frateuria defendens TaxID=2219559 RepID=UPI00066FDC35|nr:DUF3293 domain-containing protein [Frateuria defendens]